MEINHRLSFQEIHHRQREPQKRQLRMCPKSSTPNRQRKMVMIRMQLRYTIPGNHQPNLQQGEAAADPHQAT